MLPGLSLAWDRAPPTRVGAPVDRLPGPRRRQQQRQRQLSTPDPDPAARDREIAQLRDALRRHGQ
jgi:hypothetical protein